MILVGAFSAASAPNPLFGYGVPILALIGLVTGAGYFLWALQRMFFGTFWIKSKEDVQLQLQEPDLLHKLIWYPLLLATILAGLFPSFWLEGLGPSAQWFSSMLQQLP